MQEHHQGQLLRKPVEGQLPSATVMSRILRGLVGGGRMPVILISGEESLPTYKALLIFLSVCSQLCEGLLEMWWSGQMRWLGVSKS